jgi:hypothetical protein
MTHANKPPTDSVADIINAVAGYPEYYYWKFYYFLPTVNAANNKIFEPIKMYESLTDPNVNY